MFVQYLSLMPPDAVKETMQFTWNNVILNDPLKISEALNIFNHAMSRRKLL